MCRTGLDIEEPHVLGIALNKGSARFYVFTHQD